MGESKNFIKSAVGLLLVVAICFLSVMIYKKGNESIQNSIHDYDEIVSQFDSAKWAQYEQTLVTGSQITALIRNLKKEDGITIQVANGYLISEKKKAQEYSFKTVFEDNSTLLFDIKDRTKEEYYINPASMFASSTLYDENGAINGILFIQE